LITDDSRKRYFHRVSILSVKVISVEVTRLLEWMLYYQNELSNLCLNHL
jgi:hypothetical protein